MEERDIPPVLIYAHVRAPWWIRAQVAWDCAKFIARLLNPFLAGAVMKSEWGIEEKWKP